MTNGYLSGNTEGLAAASAVAKGGLEGRAEVWVGRGSSRSGKVSELAAKPAPSDLVWAPPL